MGKVRNIHAALMALGTSVLVIGCSGSSSASTTCGDFLDASRDRQLEMAADWVDDNTSLSSEMAGVAIGYRRALSDHCAANRDDELDGLRVTAGQ